MARTSAIKQALELSMVPSLSRRFRRDDLPDDVLQVIRIAAGCEETCQEGVRATGAGPDAIRSAAVHYLHAVMFFPEASSYRILGVNSGAPRATLVQHKRWLLRWLHPDLNHNAWEARLFDRVLTAWNDISKQPDGAEPLPPASARPIMMDGSLWNDTLRSSPPFVFRQTALPPRPPRTITAKTWIAVVLVAAGGLAIFAVEDRFESFWMLQADPETPRAVDASGQAEMRPVDLQQLPPSRAP